MRPFVHISHVQIAVLFLISHRPYLASVVGRRGYLYLSLLYKVVCPQSQYFNICARNLLSARDSSVPYSYFLYNSDRLIQEPSTPRQKPIFRHLSSLCSLLFVCTFILHMFGSFNFNVCQQQQQKLYPATTIAGWLQ